MRPSSLEPAPPPAVSSPLWAGSAPGTVLFDHDHGQANWSQTGFTPRLMERNFLGLAEHLRGPHSPCVATGSRSLTDLLPEARLLVIPPPTGTYHPRRECWRPRVASFFTARELEAVLAFVHAGGRLLAFSYRFGDSFTQTNLGELCGPLGCLLNHDAVIDLTRLRTTHPLQACFDTDLDALPLAWSQPGVRTVRWRAMATFTIVPGARACPLALSPGGRCVSFDRTRRRISFESLPIAVAGLHGRGRFVVLGGPHVFELGPFGLLGSADNGHFLRNVLRWLQGDDPLVADLGPPPQARQPQWEPPRLTPSARELAQIECKGRGTGTVLSVERLLRRTGMLKALGRARWMP